VTYAELLARSAQVASHLLRGTRGDDQTGREGMKDLAERPVAYLVSPGWEYVAVQWGIWRAGGLAVPLSPLHPPAEVAHVLDDAHPETVIVDTALEATVREAAGGRSVERIRTDALLGDPTGISADGESAPWEVALPDVDPARAALMLYTSGTTGRPKGVVITHRNLEAQVTSMVQAWEWTAEDRILTHLPLHHVHGIVNAITTALWSGAFCEIQPRFHPETVWERLAQGDLTLYMAVPTVYRRLIEAWESAGPTQRERWTAGARQCRLMVSGSAALPVPTLERWETITGHRLLERYGMTEIGMALSNPLHGERRPGFVGVPMPGVQARIVDDAGTPLAAGIAGEIQVRGPTVFREYWRRPDETAAAFAEGRWFRTGDQAVVEDGAWRILGRRSVDILKTGGEKVSALEIEDVLRLHPGVADCAVVGVDDPDWGQRICAAVVPRDEGDAVNTAEIRDFLKARLAPYKVPKEYRWLEALPSNAMGKVSKPRVRALFEETPRRP
jgi:malonyl-CoA/methylmalonyl-CoA synthetase